MHRHLACSVPSCWSTDSTLQAELAEKQKHGDQRAWTIPGMISALRLVLRKASGLRIAPGWCPSSTDVRLQPHELAHGGGDLVWTQKHCCTTTTSSNILALLDRVAVCTRSSTSLVAWLTLDPCHNRFFLDSLPYHCTWCLSVLIHGLVWI